MRNSKYSKLIRKLIARKPSGLDGVFHEIHDQVFSNINCLECANCCKTTSPIFTDRDIDRIASFLGDRPSKIVEKFLKIDSDGDFVFKKSPCAFLNVDNTCAVYDARPRACREYPHTNRKNMHQILKLTERNSDVCPAVDSILEAIQKKMGL